MPQQTETRLFSSGIDTDNALHAIENGSVLNMVNLRMLRQNGQSAGKVEWIPGNEMVAAVSNELPGGTNTLIGECVDDSTACIYMFIHNSSGDHRITEYNTNTNFARTVIEDDAVIGGFGWTADMYIDAEAGDNVMYFVDGVHDLRYVNLTTIYSTVTPMPQGQLSFISEPGLVPPEQTRGTDAGVSSTIQQTAVQFAYRILNTDGHVSVLSPYSLTAMPVRNSDLLVNADFGNTIDIEIPVEQTIPENWDRIELVARFLNSNTFFVIHRWDSSLAADVTAVINHNLGTPLALPNWAGATLEAIDEKSAAKQADAIPRAPHRLRLAANRLLLANFTEGYDTPADAPTVAIATTTYSPPAVTSTPQVPYIVIVREHTTRIWHFAIILRFNSKNYLLPKECSTGKFFHDNDQLPLGSVGNLNIRIDNGLFNIPERISEENLIELDESGDPGVLVIGAFEPGTDPPSNKPRRTNIVVEANNLTGFIADDATGLNWYILRWNATSGAPSGSIEVEAANPLLEFGAAGQERAFLNGAVYNRGIRYFDEAGRTSGVKLLGSTTIPDYNVASPSFTEKITATLPAVTTAIPSWAQYFALTFSRAGKAQRFGMFFGGIVKAMFKDGDGLVVYRDPADLQSVPTGFTIYGIGVPIPSTFSYEYSAGDYVMYSSATTISTARVIGTHAGHIVLQFTDDGFMHTIADGFSKAAQISYTTNRADYDMYLVGSLGGQDKVAFTLITGVSNADSQYEIAAFGNITGGQFGNFFSTGTQSIDIYGDAHTQIRKSDSGGGTGLAMSPNEDASSLFWVNDLGRPAPTDSVGEKTLVNYIRYSNARIPGATINGYASFDADDYKTTDITAGAVTFLALTTRGAQDGGQLLALCEHGSFAALVGQQQISSADGKNAFTATVAVIGDFNVLRGGWGCQSPRSVTVFEGKVWWVDAYKRAVIEFNESGAGNIALFKAARLWDTLLGAVTAPQNISTCVDPYAGELMVSLPVVAVTQDEIPGFPGEFNATDAPNGTIRTWRYDHAANRWMGGYTSGAEMIRCGTEVWGWKDGALWKEFVADAGNYYGNDEDAVLAIAFNAEFPKIKAPLTIRLACVTNPTKTRIVGNGSAVTGPYRRLEVVNEATIMNNRIGKGATNLAGYNANSIRNQTLKASAFAVLAIWSGGDPIELTDATIVYKLSSGQ